MCAALAFEARRLAPSATPPRLVHRMSARRVPRECRTARSGEAIDRWPRRKGRGPTTARPSSPNREAAVDRCRHARCAGRWPSGRRRRSRSASGIGRRAAARTRRALTAGLSSWARRAWRISSNGPGQSQAGELCLGGDKLAGDQRVATRALRHCRDEAKQSVSRPGGPPPELEISSRVSGARGSRSTSGLSSISRIRSRAPRCPRGSSSVW